MSNGLTLKLLTKTRDLLGHVYFVYFRKRTKGKNHKIIYVLIMLYEIESIGLTDILLKIM